MANSRHGSSPLPSYVKPAVLRLKELEKTYLISLSNKVKKQLARGKLEDFHAHHLYFYGEVAFTLGGLKPCVLLDDALVSSFAGGWAEQCLRPLMEEFQLESHGFQLHLIAHKLLTDNPRHPGFQGAYVFINTRHPDYGMVRDVFLKPWPAPIPELVIGRALGYPVLYGDGQVAYVDKSEMDAAGVCCVDMLEYLCNKHPSKDQCTMIWLHFRKCSEFWQKLGWTLTINMD